MLCSFCRGRGKLSKDVAGKFVCQYVCVCAWLRALRIWRHLLKLCMWRWNRVPRVESCLVWLVRLQDKGLHCAGRQQGRQSQPGWSSSQIHGHQCDGAFTVASGGSNIRKVHDKDASFHIALLFFILLYIVVNWHLQLTWVWHLYLFRLAQWR